MKRVFLTALIAAWLLTPLFLCGCGSGEGFAIYLTKDDIPVSQMEALSHLDIADTPVISVNDIVSYTWATHEMELTPGAYERVMALEVPTSGKSFVVCVNKAPVYWGAFWVPFSSQSFDGITIWVFPSLHEGIIIQLEPGYPSSSFFQGEDPRASPEIMESLEKSGKLK